MSSPTSIADSSGIVRCLTFSLDHPFFSANLSEFAAGVSPCNPPVLPCGWRAHISLHAIDPPVLPQGWRAHISLTTFPWRRFTSEIHIDSTHKFILQSGCGTLYKEALIRCAYCFLEILVVRFLFS